MKKKIFLGLLPLTLIGLMIFQGGCVKENFDTVPSIKDSSNLVSSVNIGEIKALVTAASGSTTINSIKSVITPALWQSIYDRNKTNGVLDTTSVVFSGYVITSDSTGNFYEVVTIQDQTGGGGIDIKINDSDIYTLYRLKPGQKVMVKLNDLYLGTYNGIHQIGSAIVEEGSLKIVGIPPALVNKYIERTGWRKKLIPDTVTIEQINSDVTGAYIQKFVCVKDVQFKDPFNNFAISGVNTSRTLADGDGNSLILRTSGYSSFATTTVPDGNGTITGVLNTYNTTRQLTIRDLNDIKFTNPRIGASIPTPNTTIKDLKALCTTSLTHITTNTVISGVIVGNDEASNIYNQLFIQDSTGGIEFKIYAKYLYAEYPVGTKVVVNCNDLYLGVENGAIKLGGLFGSSFGKLDVSIFYKKVFIVGSGYPVEPIKTTLSKVNDDLIGCLVSFDDVQFVDADMGKTWSEGNGNRNLTDMLSNKIIVYSTTYGNFATNVLPSGRGRFAAILSKYISSYELILRDLRDVNFNKPRFNFLLTQDFSSAALGSPITVGGWKNIIAQGTRTWIARSSGSGSATQYYAEMNPNNSSEANNESWLISPAVNLASGNSMNLFFQTAYNNWTSGSLEAYILTNFDGSDLSTATKTPLSNAVIAKQTDAASTWINSGFIDLSSFSGNVYVAFKYSCSGGGSATAFRVDNVKVY